MNAERIDRVNKEDMFEYLDNLRESGVTNMFGAGQYLVNTFGLRTNEAQEVLLDWMVTFEDRHKEVTG
tara:strand:- start:15 stop:218 length:204 start_codon:yes stop_codon:yes gene_type:complete